MPLLRPILKWAGAKTRLVPHIRELVPRHARRLVEPFAGSAAVALNLGFQANLMADANSDVIAVYDFLAAHPVRFVRDCRALFSAGHNTREAFGRLRDEFNASRNPYRRACLFVYLNRHGYNGLCRYNRGGGFNVPFGRYTKPRFPEKEFAVFGEFLSRAEVRCADFRAVLREAGSGDFVYCDPPYSPLSETANFTGYARGGFAHQDQLDLVAAGQAAAARGACVVISNHDTPTTRQLYAAANRLVELQVSRLISCDGANRKKAAELLVVYANESAAIPPWPGVGPFHLLPPAPAAGRMGA